MADLVTNAEVLAAWPAFASLSAARQAHLITAASTAVEKWCRRVFASATVTEYLDGGSRGRLWLDRPPITSITSVTIEGTALDNTNLDAWTFRPETGELLRGQGRGDPRFANAFPRGMRNVVVVYVGGYATIPADVKEATIEVAKHMGDRAVATGAFKSETIGDYSYTMADAGAGLALPPTAVMLLAPYVRHNVV